MHATGEVPGKRSGDYIYAERPRMTPAYLSLYKTGELKKRAQRLNARLACCDICPRKCGVNRLKGETKFCHCGVLPIVASYCDHHGEEPALSGTMGSGTIFFGNCNLRCIYCQNHQISQNHEYQKKNEVSTERLAEMMLHLQDRFGCHNINLVSPSHFVPQIIEALLEAVPMGLNIPLLYNTNGYDSLETLEELDGVIDIYLPDLKYSDNRIAKALSQATEYVKHSRDAIGEMWRQAGELRTDKAGIAISGVIVRHLILPGGLAGSRDSLTWLAREVSPRITISAMSQYHPQHKAYNHPKLSKTITDAEYDEVLEIMNILGFEYGWFQGKGADKVYLPDFEREGHPFEH